MNGSGGYGAHGRCSRAITQLEPAPFSAVPVYVAESTVRREVKRRTSRINAAHLENFYDTAQGILLMSGLYRVGVPSRHHVTGVCTGGFLESMEFIHSLFRFRSGRRVARVVLTVEEHEHALSKTQWDDVVELRRDDGDSYADVYSQFSRIVRCPIGSRNHLS